jgi:hypothetical protein
MKLKWEAKENGNLSAYRQYDGIEDYRGRIPGHLFNVFFVAWRQEYVTDFHATRGGVRFGAMQHSPGFGSESEAVAYLEEKAERLEQATRRNKKQFTAIGEAS